MAGTRNTIGNFSLCERGQAIQMTNDVLNLSQSAMLSVSTVIEE